MKIYAVEFEFIIEHLNGLIRRSSVHWKFATTKTSQEFPNWKWYAESSRWMEADVKSDTRYYAGFCSDLFRFEYNIWRTMAYDDAIEDEDEDDDDDGDDDDFSNNNNVMYLPSLHIFTSILTAFKHISLSSFIHFSCRLHLGVRVRFSVPLMCFCRSVRFGSIRMEMLM